MRTRRTLVVGILALGAVALFRLSFTRTPSRCRKESRMV